MAQPLIDIENIIEVRAKRLNLNPKGFHQQPPQSFTEFACSFNQYFDLGT